MGPVEVSPRCLVWASNTVFSTSRQRGEKKRRTDWCHQSRLFHGVSNTQPGTTPLSKVKNKSSRLRWLSHLAGSSWATCKKGFVSRHSSCSDRRLTDRPLYEDHGTSVAEFDSPPQLSRHWVLSLFGDVLYKKPWPWSQCGDNPSRSAAVCETLRPAARPLATATLTTTKVTQIADTFYPIIIKMNMKTGWS